MNKKIDDLLTQALTPSFEPDFWLNKKIIQEKKEQKIMLERKNRCIPTVVFACIAVICISTITTVAALNYLTPDIVAEKMHQTKLKESFKEEAAIWVNEVQSYGGYIVSFLGIVSGEHLSGITKDVNGNVYANKTYAVVAIENADGTPMPDISEEAYANLSFFVSPLIQGYNPVDYNAITMHGGYQEICEDGILYRIVECDNVELFADQELYLCVLDRMFINAEPYLFDDVSGEISRNEGYVGLNALFDLPIDRVKADPEKAKQYIDSLGILQNDMNEENINKELDETFISEVTEKNTQGAKIVEYALQFMGNPYVWGGTSLTEGIDSSGFTKKVYEHFGIELPHSSLKQREQGTEVYGIENAQLGDLIFYDTPTHVAIYIGNERVVHAFTTEGLCISEVYFDEIAMIRRIFDSTK